MSFKCKIFLSMILASFCFSSVVADDECDVDPDYATKKAECDEKGSEFIFRHVYTDGCDCVEATPAMIEDTSVPELSGVEGND